MRPPTTISRFLFPMFITAFLFSARAQDTRRQQQQPQDQQQRDDTYLRYPKLQASELEKGNLSRVAASPAQIKEVLIKDPGLLVELKRWIAKDASDNGQIVSDEDLTDDAVFDRLVNDVAFRSVATRLVQHYGYLRPSVNPDSALGKEQDYLAKERARRLVQIESEGESQQGRQSRNGSSQTKYLPCEPDENWDCVPESNGQQNRTNPNLDRNAPQREQNPNYQSPNDQNPNYQDQGQPYSNGQQIIQTENNLENPPFGEGNESTLLQNISDPLKQPGDLTQQSDSTNYGNGSPNSQNSLPMGPMQDQSTQHSNPENRPGDNEYAMNGSSEVRPGGVYRRKPRLADREPLSSGMVRRPNPYTDIPSLYDLYVQAPSRDLPPQRFGTAVFRDGLRNLRSIPMDLPVGPDYVVGPGDSLSIDLWGGVSTRLTRIVDREGRVTLPEAGPLLVSGRSLGEVQSAVQKAIGTQFRDTSADVSVSRLRTIRVYVVGEVEEPGAYDISSLSTALNALVAAGGQPLAAPCVL